MGKRNPYVSQKTAGPPEKRGARLRTCSYAQDCCSIKRISMRRLNAKQTSKSILQRRGTGHQSTSYEGSLA